MEAGSAVGLPSKPHGGQTYTCTTQRLSHATPRRMIRNTVMSDLSRRLQHSRTTHMQYIAHGLCTAPLKKRRAARLTSMYKQISNAIPATYSTTYCSKSRQSSTTGQFDFACPSNECNNTHIWQLDNIDDGRCLLTCYSRYCQVPRHSTQVTLVQGGPGGNEVRRAAPSAELSDKLFTR